MKRHVIFTLALCCATAGQVQAAPATVFEGKKEILYLDSWGQPDRWSPAECTVMSSKDRQADGRPTIHVHMPIDHFAGEKKYPIGWPRLGLRPKVLHEQDWTHFEHFEFSVYTEMTRAKPPKTPVTLILYCPDRHRSWSRRLGELRLNEWVQFSLPISQMKYVESVREVKFSISESSYNHGEQLHFYIGGFRFVRSAECEIASFDVKSKAVYQGQPSIQVQIDVLGVPKGISRAVPFTIRRDKKVVRKEALPVHRGRYLLDVDISELKLPPGTYHLVAFEDEPDKAKSGLFRVVASPWKED